MRFELKFNLNLIFLPFLYLIFFSYSFLNFLRDCLYTARSVSVRVRQYAVSLSFFSVSFFFAMTVSIFSR